MTKTIAVIPIRAGSKGLPGKNTKLLAGKPLYLYAVDCARALNVDRIIVATDIASIIDEACPQYEVFQRSAHSARDGAPTHEVIIELVQQLNLQGDTILILQATSPLRRSETVRAALDRFAEGIHDLVVSISEIENTALKSGTVSGGRLMPIVSAETLFMPRQGLPRLFKLDGGVFAFRGGWLIDNGSLASERIGVVESDPSELLDIDGEDDFQRAADILTERLKNCRLSI